MKDIYVIDDRQAVKNKSLITHLIWQLFPPDTLPVSTPKGICASSWSLTRDLEHVR